MFQSTLLSTKNNWQVFAEKLNEQESIQDVWNTDLEKPVVCMED